MHSLSTRTRMRVGSLEQASNLESTGGHSMYVVGLSLATLLCELVVSVQRNEFEVFAAAQPHPRKLQDAQKPGKIIQTKTKQLRTCRLKSPNNVRQRVLTVQRATQTQCRLS